MSCCDLKSVKTDCKEINAIYLVKVSDCVIEGDTIVRMKRKYGKHKRQVIKVK